MADKEHKEFCSGCRQYYNIPYGIWTPCPLCDGVGHLLTQLDKENILTNSDNHYIPLRDRWDLKSR